MMPARDADGLLQLWPTLMLERRIPGHETVNAHLKALLAAMEANREQLNTDYLRQCVNKTVVDYLERQGLGCPVNWTLQGWGKLNHLGDYHDLHNHPHAYLSGAYCVSVPPHNRRKRGRSGPRELSADAGALAGTAQTRHADPVAIACVEPRVFRPARRQPRVMSHA